MGKNSKSEVLVVDDDPVVLRMIGYALEASGIKHKLFSNGSDLLNEVHSQTPLCIIDLDIPGVHGFECLRKIKASYPKTEVVVITHTDKAAEAISAYRLGAFEYVTKPIGVDDTIGVIKSAIASFYKRKISRSYPSLNPVASNQVSLSTTRSPLMQRALRLIDKVSDSELTVLINGESGVGKTCFARYLHSVSKRKDEPFISVSCPSLPRDLIESELFGHEKGAFSGAVDRRLGRVELANNGTLFLDEISELPLNLQAKILVFLQDKTFYRLGGEKELHSNTRIIAATNRNLADMVSQGLFREDLYYRLNVFPINMPALKDRMEDLEYLCSNFIASIHQAEYGPVPDIGKEVIELLRKFEWPGNIRQLQNYLTRAYLTRKFSDRLIVNDFNFIDDATIESCEENNSIVAIPGATLSEIEEYAIRRTLECNNFNKTKSAEMLGISIKSVHNKVKKYNI
jgi:DNA-binding NtrC family response regulator